MDNEEFAKFFIMKGNRVIKTASGYWYEPHSFFFQSIPYHRAIDPDKGELRSLFFKKSAILVRFNSRANGNTFPGYIWVCNQKNYNLANLETKTRNQTRRGLERNLVKLIGFDLIIKAGWKLINDTAQRQVREPDFTTLEEWIRYCEAAASIPDFDVWGAFDRDHLVSFIVGAKIGDYYWILSQFSETAYLKNYSNNALVYTVTKSKLAEPSINKVSYGLDSVEDTSGLRKFKQGMGFSREMYNQKILINPLFKWIKSNKFIFILKYLLNVSPKSNYLRKANAILTQIID
jgi:hypothetical protein